MQARACPEGGTCRHSPTNPKPNSDELGSHCISTPVLGLPGRVPALAARFAGTKRFGQRTMQPKRRRADAVHIPCVLRHVVSESTSTFGLNTEQKAVALATGVGVGHTFWCLNAHPSESNASPSQSVFRPCSIRGYRIVPVEIPVPPFSSRPSRLRATLPPDSSAWTRPTRNQSPES